MAASLEEVDSLEAVGVVRHGMMTVPTKADSMRMRTNRQTKEILRVRHVRTGQSVGFGGLRERENQKMTPSLNYQVDGNTAIKYM